MNKNHGILVSQPRATDYVLGANSQINIARIVKDWSMYLPDNESQRNNIVDFLDCTSMSAIHAIEMQMNYLLKTNQISDEGINFLTDNGYIVNGKVKLSTRYTAGTNGTAQIQGNYQVTVADYIRGNKTHNIPAYGLLPYNDLGMTLSMTWNEFYAPIPQALIDKARKILWFFNIQYQWVNNVSDFSNSLYQAPIQAATEVCAGWDSGKTVEKCSGQPIQHCTVIYGINPLQNYLDLDHYPPYEQILAHDYELPLNMQYIVSVCPIALQNSMRGSNILTLQQNLNKIGYSLKEDGSFGPLTTQAVIDFQGKHGLSKDGIAGPLTLAKLSTIVSTVHVSKIDEFCKAICEYENANPAINNPFDLRDGTYTRNNGSIDVAKNGMAIFPTYQMGYNAGKKLIVGACSGHIPAYNEDGTIADFMNIYAPKSENDTEAYISWIGNKIGVDAETFIIKDLL